MTLYKTRGYYLDHSHEAWTKDTTNNHFEGNQVGWTAAKILALLVIFSISRYILGLHMIYCIANGVVVTLLYKHVIATLIPSTIVMPAMDVQTYVSDPKSIVNYMNCS